MPSTIDQFTVKVPNQACFPGSASTASDNPPASPFPLLKVAVAALVNLGNTASYLVSVPFVGFMVLSFYPTLGVNEVGYLSGLLEGSFHVGAFFGALIWAAISERFGRRPAVLLGLAGSSAAAIAFGFAPTFPLAMAARFAWGLLNGNIGVVKTMLSDVCPDDHTTRAFSFIGIAAGVGRIIGPTIGGLLAEPATKYPSLFGGIIVLRMFPYALPCSIGALLSLVTLVIAAVVLEETRGLAIAEQRAVDAKSASHANEREVEDHSPGDGVNDLAEETRLSVDRTSQSNPSTPPRGSSAIPPDALDEHAKTTVDVAKGGFDSSTARVEPVSTIANSMPSPPVCDQVIPAAAVPPPSNEGSDSDEEESRPWLQTKAERESQAREPVVPQSAEIGTQPAPTEGSHQRQRCKACFWFSCCARSCRLLQDPPIFITSAIYTGIGGTAIVSVEVSSLQASLVLAEPGKSKDSANIAYSYS